MSSTRCGHTPVMTVVCSPAEKMGSGGSAVALCFWFRRGGRGEAVGSEVLSVASTYVCCREGIIDL